MSTEPEQTEVSSEAELSDQALEVVVGGQSIQQSTGPGQFASGDDSEPPTSRTGPYNPAPRPKF